jgi:hypothetical protein
MSVQIVDTKTGKVVRTAAQVRKDRLAKEAASKSNAK